MATLHVLEGPAPYPGLTFELRENAPDIGRSPDLGIVLADRGVSRRHLRVARQGDRWVAEDLGSSNGTHVNGLKILQPVPLRSGDQIQVGPFVLVFSDGAAGEADPMILSMTQVGGDSDEIFRDASGRRLRAIMDLTRSLGGEAEPGALFDRLAVHLFRLFPSADRILMVDVPADGPRVAGARMCDGKAASNRTFSRTLLRRVTTENIGVVASMQSDAEREGHSLYEMGVQSFVCVPLQDEDGKPCGALFADRFRPGPPFSHEDLMLLTTIGIQMSTSLQVGRMHARLIDQARLQRDVAVAREIQRGYLPDLAATCLPAGYEIAAMLAPAREVAGDFYDRLALADGRMLLAVGDVAGKGIPAALFLTSVRALLRHFATTIADPGELLRALNDAVAADNPNMTFVTLALAAVEPGVGRMVVATGGHPPPIRFGGGRAAAPLRHRHGPLVGFDRATSPYPTTVVDLAPGEALLFYTDGVTEAPTTGAKPGEEFGVRRLNEFLAAQPAGTSLDRIHGSLCAELERFCGTKAMEDDVTLLSIRRREE